MMEFDNFKSPLNDLIKKNFLTNQELNSLWDNYQKIETCWFQNFQNIKEVNLILLGELPLRHSSYIYNQGSADSAFLYKRHLLKCMQIRHGTNADDFNKTKIELMLDLGILVLDLFPYSFSIENNFNFRNKNKSNKTFIKPNMEHQKILIHLFNESYPWHLAKKIETILKKTSLKTKYAYRYKACAELNLEIFPKDPKISLGKSYDMNSKIFYAIFKKA